MGRPRTCDCGTCAKCQHREHERARYQGLSAEERKAVIARRDKTKINSRTRAANRERWVSDPEWRQRKIERDRSYGDPRKKNPEKAKARSVFQKQVQLG